MLTLNGNRLYLGSIKKQFLGATAMAAEFNSKLRDALGAVDFYAREGLILSLRHFQSVFYALTA